MVGYMMWSMTYDLHDRLKPIGPILNLKSEGWTVWDCSPIYGPDARAHVFASRWPDNDQPGRTWFLGGSQIIHAVASGPAGPPAAVPAGTVTGDADRAPEDSDAAVVVRG